MVAETHIRQGFLTDEQFELLRDALPDYLRPLFVTGNFTGVRLGELLAIRWNQVDWEQGFMEDGLRRGRCTRREVPRSPADGRSEYAPVRSSPSRSGCESPVIVPIPWSGGTTSSTSRTSIQPKN